MIDDKVGVKPYLGININYNKEKKLDRFSLDTLKDRSVSYTHLRAHET